MRRSAIIALLALAAVGSSTSTALAAPPANDGPGGAVSLAPFTAENGRPTETTGVADLAEATPDAGVPRCLGPRSFARTAWLRVPAAGVTRILRLTALTPSLEADVAPQLAAFVQAPGGGVLAREPQACDGGTPGVDPTAGVELVVGAGRDVLLQAGAGEGSALRRVVIGLEARDVPSAAMAPLGDLGTLSAPRLALGRSSVVRTGGATMTQEDPAQPACPAAATVWRRATAARTGTHVAALRGTVAGALTVFGGSRPTGEGALACANRGSAPTTAVSFRARRGQRLWLRVGADRPTDAALRLAVSGPCDVQPLTTARRPTARIVAVRGRQARLRIGGGCLKAVRLVSRGRTVGRVAVAPTGTRSVRLRRAVPRRTLRIVARDAARRGTRPTVRGR